MRKLFWATMCVSWVPLFFLPAQAQENMDEPKDTILENETEKRQELEAEKALSERKEALRLFDLQREANPTVTEYSIDPGSVEAVVELDPNNYGFRQRNHRMTLGSELDFLFRGRALLFYDFRFFEYWTLSLKTGVDWTGMALYHKFQEAAAPTRTPSQLSVLGAVALKWRLTEWYLKSSVFVEPTVSGGYMWQELFDQKSEHWVFLPGINVGIQTVFDSGLSLAFRGGIEVPVDFGNTNPVKESLNTLMGVSVGFSL